MARRRRKKKHFLLFTFVTFFRIGKKYPRVSVLTLLPLVGGYSHEVLLARPDMAYQGVPQTQVWYQPLTWSRVFRNDGFMVGYSDIRGNPLWVIYQVTSIKDNARIHKRPQTFSTDWRSLTRISHQDYTRSGFDRGHMAPNYAISRLYGKQAQLDTFLMTNITPQRSNLNQKVWQRLEAVEVDYFPILHRHVWVITGPVFSNPLNRLKSSWKVEVPEAFYKIYAAETGSGIKMLAFLIPQTVRGNEPLTDFIVSVDTIEKLTGLDFFHELDDPLEDKLEAAINPKPWKLNSVARLPSRY
ncbi:DNA/RNA non-specific endonuclease [Methylotuvimicrobium sp.]